MQRGSMFFTKILLKCIEFIDENMVTVTVFTRIVNCMSNKSGLI